MTLIVEDGTGKADAESYISVSDADAYFSKRGNAAWAALTTEQKEQNLRKGADYLRQAYRLRWSGVRKTATQALDWPRSFVPYEDYEYSGMNGSTVIGGNYYYPDNVVPVEVAQANAEAAVRSSVAELAPDVGRVTKREKVDVIEVEYADYAKPFTTYRVIDGLLLPFLGGSSSGVSVKVVRT